MSPQTRVTLIDFIVKLALVDSGGKKVDLGKRSSVSLPGNPHDALEAPTCVSRRVPPAHSIAIAVNHEY
jgi:hypothetical protein